MCVYSEPGEALMRGAMLRKAEKGDSVLPSTKDLN